jgi:NTE family protein
MTSTQPRRAVVLGSGGVLGFAWLLGALAAVEDEAGFDVRTAEVAIGTSAGSVAAALLGCGLSVDVMCRHHQGEPAPDDPAIEYDYHSGAGEALPPRPGWRPAAPRLTWDGLTHRRHVSPLVALSGLLPPGRASLGAIHALVNGVAAATGFADRWPESPRPWIAAMDYVSGRRVLFGRFADGTDAATPDRAIRRARLADAVQASCSIPGWYPPTEIDGVRYVDGGVVSIASVDALRHTGANEAYVLVPMASVDPDHPRGTAARLERRLRRAITRRIVAEVAKLRAMGMRVVLLTPVASDLEAMGVNMMDPARRTDVLDSARQTAAAQLRAQVAAQVDQAWPVARGSSIGDGA